MPASSGTVEGSLTAGKRELWGKGGRKITGSQPSSRSGEKGNYPTTRFRRKNGKAGGGEKIFILSL